MFKSTSRKRRIGGSRKAARGGAKSKAELLREAKQLRAKRAVDRKQTGAAVRVQALWRGSRGLDLRRKREEVVASFNQRVLACTRDLASTSPQDVAAIVRDFLFLSGEDARLLRLDRRAPSPVRARDGNAKAVDDKGRRSERIEVSFL